MVWANPLPSPPPVSYRVKDDCAFSYCSSWNIPSFSNSWVQIFILLSVTSTFKVAVGPNLLTNRNLKQNITIECTKTAIFQLLWPVDFSKRAYTIVCHKMDLLLSRSNTSAILWLGSVKKRYNVDCDKVYPSSLPYEADPVNIIFQHMLRLGSL